MRRSGLAASGWAVVLIAAGVAASGDRVESLLTALAVVGAYAAVLAGVFIGRARRHRPLPAVARCTGEWPTTRTPWRLLAPRLLVTGAAFTAPLILLIATPDREGRDLWLGAVGGLMLAGGCDVLAHACWFARRRRASGQWLYCLPTPLAAWRPRDGVWRYAPQAGRN